MKTRITVLLLCFFIAASLLYSQPKDVPGYMKTKWGMTEQDILNAMKDEVVKLKGKKYFGYNSYAILGMKEVVIDSNKFVAHFLMNKTTNLLTQVNLDIFYQNIEDPNKSFDSMKSALEKEYGKATAELSSVNPKTQSPTRKIVWVFPSTIVFYIAWDRNLEKSMLQYFQNDGRKNLETLGFVPRKTTDTKKEPDKSVQKEEKK